MKTNQTSVSTVIDDFDFLTLFESKQLDEALFDHVGHLRIAWLYLNKYEPDVAIDKICSGIAAYAESLGATQKFNLTLTNALARIMAKRIASMTERSWFHFQIENQDLVNDALSVLYKHYSKATLMSDRSRQTFLLPDREPI